MNIFKGKNAAKTNSSLGIAMLRVPYSLSIQIILAAEWTVDTESYSCIPPYLRKIPMVIQGLDIRSYICDLNAYWQNWSNHIQVNLLTVFRDVEPMKQCIQIQLLHNEPNASLLSQVQSQAESYR